MKQIIILEKDTATSTAISKLALALNLLPTVLLRWSSNAKTISLKDVAAVFANVETPGNNLEEIIQYFCLEPRKNNTREIPVFFLYSRENSEMYEAVKELPHSGEIKKPFKLEELYTLCEQKLDLSEMRRQEFSSRSRLKHYVDFASDFESWLNSLNNLLNR